MACNNGSEGGEGGFIGCGGRFHADVDAGGRGDSPRPWRWCQSPVPNPGWTSHRSIFGEARRHLLQEAVTALPSQISGGIGAGVGGDVHLLTPGTPMSELLQQDRAPVDMAGLIDRCTADQTAEPSPEIPFGGEGPDVPRHPQIGLLHDLARGEGLPGTMCGIAQQQQVVTLVKPAPRFLIASSEPACPAAQRGLDTRLGEQVVHHARQRFDGQQGSAVTVHFSSFSVPPRQRLAPWPGSGSRPPQRWPPFRSPRIPFARGAA